MGKRCIPVDANDPAAVARLAGEIDPDVVVVSAEEPLVHGVADALRSHGMLVFGPGADGARLEGSKAWMKAVLAEAGVPTARHASFTADQEDEALAFLDRLPGLYVVGEVMERAVGPTLHALAARDIAYRGVLYAGLMLTPEGVKVLEYNVRFGDPEAQAVLPRLASDFGRLCHEAAAGRADLDTRFREDACVTVVLATEGYPATPRKGDFIEGIDAAEELSGVTVFHAGTKQVDSRVMTAGGRVLDVTAVAPTLLEARDRAYEAAGRISWPGVQYRRDIGAAAVESEGKEPA